MSEEEIIFYTPNIEANKKKLQHIHDIMSLALGMGAGILTLESLYGFSFYLIGISITNLIFYIACCEGKPEEYFRSPLHEIFIKGLTSNAAGYVMMWCLVFALVK